MMKHICEECNKEYYEFDNEYLDNRIVCICDICAYKGEGKHEKVQMR